MAWQGSTRSGRLPDDWETRCKPEADRRNPQRICHFCGLPGGDELDHLVRGDDHSPENLDWIHGRRAYLAGKSKQNCHGIKSGLEGRAARPRERRPPDVHPGLR